MYKKTENKELKSFLEASSPYLLYTIAKNILFYADFFVKLGRIFTIIYLCKIKLRNK